MSAFTRLSLRHGQQARSYLVCGVGAQDACVMTLLKSPWLIHPPLLSVSSSHRGRSRFLSSSVLRSPPVSTNASVESGEAQTIEQVWEEYFADPLQWRDNRVNKGNPQLPDFEHKVAKKVLWVDGWSTPRWVKAMLKLVILRKLPSHVGYHMNDSQEIVHPNRFPNGNIGTNILPTSQESKKAIKVGGGSMRMQSVKTTCEAIDVLKNRLQQGITIDSYTFVEVLQRCLKQEDLTAVKQVHECIIESGMQQNIYVANNLLIAYIRCGRLKDADRVFDELKRKDVISWNVMIGGYAQHSRAEDAMAVFNQMRQEGAQPDAVTFLNTLKAFGSPSALKWGEEVHAYIRNRGFESDVRVGTALLRMYAKCGSIEEARKTFDKLASRNGISWTVMIGAYAESGCGEEACRLLLQMEREGFKPDAVTYVSILNACATAGALDWVKEVHSHAREAGFESDLRVSNALVHMYAKSGSINDARLVFDRMEERDVVTWTAMIGGLAQHGCGSEALDVFRNMNAAGVKPNGYSFAAVLTACSHAGLVDEGRQLFQAMSQEYGIVPSVLHWTCMVDILGRAGHLEEAKRLIDNMPVEPDGAIWGALLGACRSYGNVELGELAAIERAKLEPNDVSSFVILSNIYAAADQWEKVSLVRTMMQERGVYKEPGRSWIEVGNKTHTFVVGDTSHPKTNEIYAELSRLTEIMKAEGYHPDTRLVLHDVDEKDKEFSLCSHSERLAIAYGLISTPSSKPICVYKNLRVCSDCHTATKLISKVTRRDIVVRDANRFHHFKEGFCSCKDYW